jgi:ABC-2 type transport system permease protein
MQSKTSFFNRTIFRKTVSRFWPLWAAHLVIWIIILPIPLLAGRADLARDAVGARELVLSVALYGGVAMSAVFAVFSAMAVWSFLYSARSASGVASLPVRREGLFVSGALAGLLPLLCGELIAFLLALLAELSVGAAHFASIAQGFAIAGMQLIAFYGFATLCAQLTGHILILPAVYAVLNFTAVAVEMLVRYVLSLFVFGISSDFDRLALRWFSPVIGIASTCDVRRPSLPDPATGIWQSGNDVTFSGWGLLAVYAAIGVVLLVCALLLFRRRRMETAGDVVAVRVLKPVFRWCMALGCALVLGSLINVIFFETYRFDEGRPQLQMLLTMAVTMLIGAFIGWFASEMLMKKTFRVFRGWAGFGLCCLVIVALLFAAEFDLFGYERRVPDAGKVASARILVSGEQVDLEQPENIAQVCALHRSIVENKATNERSPADLYGSEGVGKGVTLRYTLKSGRVLIRRYQLSCIMDVPATYGDLAPLQEVVNCPEAIADRKELRYPVTRDTIETGSVNAMLPPAACAALAGYGDDVEAYVLREVYGFSQAEIAAMDETQRQSYLSDASSLYMNYGDAEGHDEPASLLPYNWVLTPAETEDLFRSCILPDIADGTLGRIWIIQDRSYAETVCSASVDIDLRVRRTAQPGDPTGPGQTMPYDFDDYDHEYFHTVPTVDSVRTNAWLEAHGVVLRTVAETNREAYSR